MKQKACQPRERDLQRFCAWRARSNAVIDSARPNATSQWLAMARLVSRMVHDSRSGTWRAVASAPRSFARPFCR